MTMHWQSRSFLQLLMLAVVISTAPTVAQEVEDLATRANAAMESSDWAQSAKLYGELTRVSPDDATAWYRLGLSTLRSGGDGTAARAALVTSAQLGFAPGAALVAVARSYLTDGDTAAALKTLETLVEQGPLRAVAQQLKTDATFAPLAEDPKFLAIINELTPCSGEQYRQFDFWLGRWDVVSPQGQTLGTNIVTPSMDGCLLIENWESAAGGQKGISFNYYDRDKGSWSQIYRDNTGNITQWPELVGGLVDGVMVLDSGPDTLPRSRWKWSRESGGRVRQMAESTADGQTWNTIWDSYYVPMGE